MDISEEDYQKAVAVVRKCLTSSVSNLQRKLYWGYGRAASAIDRMQDEFIVSPMSASGRRDVYPEEMHQLWKDLQEAKAQAVPEGFVLVPKENISCFWQDNDEPENFCNSSNDWDCLGDGIEKDQIMIVNKHTQAHISTEKFFGVWKLIETSYGTRWKFELFKSEFEAKQAMLEAQEQKG